MTHCYRCHHATESPPPKPPFAEPKKPICRMCAPDNTALARDDEVVVERAEVSQ